MMNGLIIKKFSELVKQNNSEYLNAQVENDKDETERQKRRLISNKKILQIIKGLTFEIKSHQDVIGIPGIGKGTISRIKEILETGDLSELNNKYADEKQKKIDSIIDLENVIGIGSKTAKKIIMEHGINSVTELKNAILTGKFNANSKIMLGLKYYDLVKTNIPRKEIEKIEKYLIDMCHGLDPRLKLTVCGSYRRGKLTSGDIDVLIYHPSIKTKEQAIKPKNDHLAKLITTLENDNFLLDAISYKRIKYLGFCQYQKNPVRRIDIQFIPTESVYSALLYFTGPVQLNTYMRTEAKKRGYLLNEYGLFDKDNKMFRVGSEKEIFELVGMKYLTPTERENFNLANSKSGKKLLSV